MGSDRWTTKEEGLLYLAGDGQEPLWQTVQGGDLRGLEEAKFGVSPAGHSVRLDLTTCPGCTESSFLSAQAVTYSVDKKGDVSEKVKTIFSNLAIAPVAVEYLQVKSQQAVAEGQAAEDVGRAADYGEDSA